jgi:hypothetical protein
MWKLIVATFALATVLAMSALIGATPASAVTGVGVVEVSDDGVNFDRNYPGGLFDAIAQLVPGDSQSETVYVRNSGTAAGYLRVTLRDVNYSDQKFADALTVTTSTPSSVGSAAAISSANPCQVVHEGTLIAPGEIVPVVATLALGNLNGADGQGATATLAMRFTLSDATAGTLPPTNCGTGGTTVPVTPGTAGSTNTRGPSGATSSSESSVGAAFVTVPSPGSNAAPSLVETPSTGVLPVFPSSFTLDPNTWRLYQEYLVLILFLATMIGAWISWLIGRRSRKDTQDA